MVHFKERVKDVRKAEKKLITRLKFVKCYVPRFY